MRIRSKNRSAFQYAVCALPKMAKVGGAVLLCLSATMLSAGIKHASPDYTLSLIQACKLENWEATVWDTDKEKIVDRSPTMSSSKSQCVDRFMEQVNRKKD